MSATLRVTREVGTFMPELHRGRFEVAVDGSPVGSVDNHQSVEVQVPPGAHSLQLSQGRYKSRRVTFQVADGGTAPFQCHGARIWVTWLLSLFVPNMGISLRQE
jgi:hypothetical protein